MTLLARMQLDCVRMSHASACVVAVSIATAQAGRAEPPPGAASCSGCHPAKPGVDTAVPRLPGRSAAEHRRPRCRPSERAAPGTVMDRIAKGFSDAEIAGHRRLVRGAAVSGEPCDGRQAQPPASS